MGQDDCFRAFRLVFDRQVPTSAAGPNGRRLAGERSQCVVNRETFAETQNKGLSFRRDIAIQPEAATLRVLVRDSANGAVGSLAVPIGQGRKSKGQAD